MMRYRVSEWVLTATLIASIGILVVGTATFATRSGILPWVDPATPADHQTYQSSRGDVWILTMSDEFNTPSRSFEPGKDHLWTSVEKPDGVNAALEVYSHNMTTTACDNDDETCYFRITAMEDEISLTVWNNYITPPGYQNVSFYYRAGMVQSWNKFCFQGGMVEVRVQLPGATSIESGNPDIANGSASTRITSSTYYPTWPGIWMMGNLGRAIFSASTARMWPFTYNECNETMFISQNQRISACDASPGSGLNANQGRGAPEIDILEGAGTIISSSIQIGPGMPTNFRKVIDKTNPSGCIYSFSCETKGANNIGVPTGLYDARGHKSWYQSLRYGGNPYCAHDSSLIQLYETIKASLDDGITENACTVDICPASLDVNGDLSFMDGSTTDRWGINANGSCFSLQNEYTGAYLCSAGNKASSCSGTEGSTDESEEFAYQMDAISANWPLHVGAYTEWLVYQLEWVTGDEGYVRWMVAGSPLFEIPADAITNPPQDSGQTNPRKIMIEEPMYLIFNVALSSSWGATPPNAGKACRGDGSDETASAICDAFPMYLKIDYIRVYQDTSSGSNMAIGCDPSTHPTAKWIQDHIDEYTDSDNPWTEVSGKAFCESDDDCTVSADSGIIVATGTCEGNRCSCRAGSWKGPRCTVALSAASSTSTNVFSGESYGPPMTASIVFLGLTVLATFAAVFMSTVEARKRDDELRRKILMAQFRKEQEVKKMSRDSDATPTDTLYRPLQDSYSTNFV